MVASTQPLVLLAILTQVKHLVSPDFRMHEQVPYVYNTIIFFILLKINLFPETFMKRCQLEEETVVNIGIRSINKSLKLFLFLRSLVNFVFNLFVHFV